MLIVMLYLRKFYGLSVWKTILLSVLLTLSGTIGTKLLFWIENGSFSGVSFFGAIFFCTNLNGACGIGIERTCRKGFGYLRAGRMYDADTDEG